MSEFFECPFHHVQIERGSKTGCADCITFYESRTQADADALSGEDREAEVRRILDAPMTTALSVFWPWIDMLVGRAVYTHEFAMPDALANEARNHVHPDAAGIVQRLQTLAGDKPVVVVIADDAS